MTLDLVVPTYNREKLLSRFLESLRAADQPEGLRIRTIVVDNNSTDGTRALVERARLDWPPRTLEYRFEPQQSRSAALNNGLSTVTAEVVGMLDDDEEIHPQWFSVVARMFEDPSVDFISGPYLPRWGGPQPEWLPKDDYPGVIGWLDVSDRVLEYGKNYDGVMMGGNAVVRTAVGRAVGWFHPLLGRVGAHVGSGCEDVDFFERLQRSGARGLYVPDLIIYHYIPPHRLTKRSLPRVVLPAIRRAGGGRRVATAAGGIFVRRPALHDPKSISIDPCRDLVGARPSTERQHRLLARARDVGTRRVSRGHSEASTDDRPRVKKLAHVKLPARQVILSRCRRATTGVLNLCCKLH